MTEAVGAIMQWGFGAFDELDRVVTSAISANVGSRRVLEKCGFEFVGLVVEEWEKLVEPVELAAYILRRDRWTGLSSSDGAAL